MKFRTHILKSIFAAFLLVVSTQVVSQVLRVKQDGTGDFIQIQQAVDAAANGDTVLVWPGEYIENVIIENKYIILASLYLTTNNESYIDSTIINGNQSGSGVAILEGSDTTILIGFSITNGSGYPVYPEYFCGGGVIVYYSSAIIGHCNIHDNMAHDGGGGLSIRFSLVEIDNCIIHHNFSPDAAGGVSCTFDSHVFFKGTDIISNHAYYNAGGLLIVGSEVVFDSINRCNIYMNYSGAGCDISIHNSSILNTIFADTLTVPNPGHYFVSSYDDYGYPLNDIEIDALASKITPYDGDLFVNPVHGSDDNSGTHPDSALKTIAFANAKIIVDSINRNTIHLAGGIYSDSANSEKFPLNIRPFVHVKGAGRDETILDGMFKSYLIKGNTTVSSYKFSNMSMQRGTMVDYDNTFNNTDLFGFIYWGNNNIVFDSIKFRNGIGRPGNAGIVLNGTKNATISNCIFEDVKGLEVLDVSLFHGDTTYINNCTFNHNKPDENNPDWNYGKALRVHGVYDEDDPFVAIIQNSLFNNNDENAFLTTDGLVYLINNTFVNNTLESLDVAAINNWASRGHMYNCISYNNGVFPFFIWELEGIPSEFSVYNSCIEGGISSFTVGPNSTINYDATNIDTDPLFFNGPEYPYNLSNNSPCIDAGTLDIPEWIELYPYDLAGNPRVHGQSIDMGAYEWNPTVGVKEVAHQNPKHNMLLAAPNPFTHKTAIKAAIKENTDIRIVIYNNNGQPIRNLFDGFLATEKKEFQWDGTDDSGKDCPEGIFLLVLSNKNRVVECLQIVKVGH